MAQNVMHLQLVHPLMVPNVDGREDAALLTNTMLTALVILSSDVMRDIKTRAEIHTHSLLLSLLLLPASLDPIS